MRSKVQAELQQLQGLGVISPVQEHTPWCACAAMVVVPKYPVVVRICVGLKPLNQSVLREFIPCPR